VALFVIGVDPIELARLRHYDPTEDIVAALDGEVEPEPIDWSTDKERLRELMEMLPPVEQDMLELLATGKRQQDIAEIFQLTQAAVSYRLVRAKKRLQFLRDFPVVSEAEMRADLTPAFPKAWWIDLFWDLSLTTSQSHTAKRLGWTQGKVRHNIFRIRDLLHRDPLSTVEKLAPYRKMSAMLCDKQWMNLMAVQAAPNHPRPTEFCGRLGVLLAAAVPPSNDHVLQVADRVGVLHADDLPPAADVVALDFLPGFGVEQVENENAAPSRVVVDAE
jgi:hypothetical protein